MILDLVTGKTYNVDSIHKIPGNPYYRGRSSDFIKINVIANEISRLQTQLQNCIKRNDISSIGFFNTVRALRSLGSKI